MIFLRHLRISSSNHSTSNQIFRTWEKLMITGITGEIRLGHGERMSLHLDLVKFQSESRSENPLPSPIIIVIITILTIMIHHHYQLDLVYCTWLIKWVAKREIIQLTELCPMRWWIISGTWWYWVNIWQYWLVFCQYKLVMLGIRWYRVSKGLVCLYILEKVEIWSGVTDAWQTDNRI